MREPQSIEPVDFHRFGNSDARRDKPRRFGIEIGDVTIGQATVRHDEGQERQVVEAIEDAGFDVAGREPAG